MPCLDTPKNVLADAWPPPPRSPSPPPFAGCRCRCWLTASSSTTFFCSLSSTTPSSSSTTFFCHLLALHPASSYSTIFLCTSLLLLVDVIHHHHHYATLLFGTFSFKFSWMHGVFYAMADVTLLLHRHMLLLLTLLKLPPDFCHRQPSLLLQVFVAGLHMQFVVCTSSDG